MLRAACVPCPVPRLTPQQGLMNAEHESQASSLRALNPLLTHRRGKGGHYDNVQGVQSECRRGERKEKSRITMENVLNYKICKMIKQMQVKRKFVGLPFVSFLSPFAITISLRRPIVRNECQNEPRIDKPLTKSD